MNLPNKLTCLRMLLVPILVVIAYLPIDGMCGFIPVKNLILLAIFCIASITDYFDGKIARKNNMITTFGKFLDPIADKIVVVTALLLLVENGKCPAWVPIIVIFREFLVSGYRLVVVEKNGKVIAANIWGKIKTFTQMIAIGLMFVDQGIYFECVTGKLSGFPLVLNIVTSVLLTFSVIATIFSGYEYMKDYKKVL
jgi:CDP-diacylglycerol--glycerol-3-phosphate 3-phosphatidyltransferase